MLNAIGIGIRKSSYMLNAGVVVIGGVATCYMLNAGASDNQKSSYLLHAKCYWYWSSEE